MAPTDVGVVAGFRDHNTECVDCCSWSLLSLSTLSHVCSCIVDFPDHPGWLGLVDELEKADMPATSECATMISVVILL